MIYIQLFLSFLQVGALSFGGGYAAMPLIQEQVVNLHSWLSMSEFTNLITIAGTDCSKLCYFCRDADSGDLRCNNCYIGMYSSLLYYCNLAGICLYEVSEYVFTSGNTGISQTGSCIDDRQSRGNDFNFCIFH